MTREERKIAALMAQFERMEQRARKDEPAQPKEKESRSTPRPGAQHCVAIALLMCCSRHVSCRAAKRGTDAVEHVSRGIPRRLCQHRHIDRRAGQSNAQVRTAVR